MRIRKREKNNNLNPKENLIKSNKKTKYQKFHPNAKKKKRNRKKRFKKHKLNYRTKEKMINLKKRKSLPKSLYSLMLQVIIFNKLKFKRFKIIKMSKFKKRRKSHENQSIKISWRGKGCLRLQFISLKITCLNVLFKGSQSFRQKMQDLHKTNMGGLNIRKLTWTRLLEK